MKKPVLFPVYLVTAFAAIAFTVHATGDGCSGVPAHIHSRTNPKQRSGKQPIHFSFHQIVLRSILYY